MRIGLIAQKVGMTRIFSSDGQHLPVTVLHVENCQILRVKKEKNFNIVQLGSFDQKANRLSKPMKGYFSKLQIGPKKKLMEFKGKLDDEFTIGKQILPSLFSPGQRVDVSGLSKGKGFAGVMKRHNFSGNRASHGVSISHRSAGSTGQCQDPGRTFKGKKMAGHLGSEKVTAKSIEVVAVDDDQGIIMLRGSVPGFKGAYVKVSDAKKIFKEKKHPPQETKEGKSKDGKKKDSAKSSGEESKEKTQVAGQPEKKGKNEGK